jgi:pseudouridine-5'-phosphate glycosidase
VIQVSEGVREAVAAGRPVVALESTIIAHGLPRPGNLDTARALERTVRDHGAVPATIAVLDGVARVGLDTAAIERVATDSGLVKASVRDLGPVVAAGGSAATTVASTAHLAARCGVRLFATGGLGGVHRGAATSFDESADLDALAWTPVTIVCAGVKSILDVGATLERLESRSVPVVGMATDRFPAFYLADSGHPVPWRVESPDEVAQIVRARERLGVAGGVVVANPVSVDEQMDPELHERLLAGALAAAEQRGVTGKEVTPFVLGWLHANSGGESLRVNVALARANAALAAEIAVALSE